MKPNNSSQSFMLGVFIFLGLAVLGWLLSQAAISVKEYERSVRVKGLSEREFEADKAIWPISFSVASNNLQELYKDIDDKTKMITEFLAGGGIESTVVTASTPAIADKMVHQYGIHNRPEFRYDASRVVTVYSSNIKAVRALQSSLSELGKKGIFFTTDPYNSATEYLFTRLNEVKPSMIEEATRKARQVAEKFANDSQSSLGKIKRASQGQFSISSRDRNNPHIKQVRVVSTVEYYLSD